MQACTIQYSVEALSNIVALVRKPMPYSSCVDGPKLVHNGRSDNRGWSWFCQLLLVCVHTCTFCRRISSAPRSSNHFPVQTETVNDTVAQLPGWCYSVQPSASSISENERVTRKFNVEQPASPKFPDCSDAVEHI